MITVSMLRYNANIRLAILILHINFKCQPAVRHATALGLAAQVNRGSSKGGPEPLLVRVMGDL